MEIVRPDPPEAEKDHLRDGKHSMARSPGRVLIVDDDEDMRTLLEDTLRDAGYVPAGASDILAATIHLHSQPVDVMVLDWKMPDLDGFKLLETVRRILPGLPVIFITAHNRPDIHRRALHEGAFGFLAKPFPLRLLLAEIEGALFGRDRRIQGTGTRPEPH